MVVGLELNVFTRHSCLEMKVRGRLLREKDVKTSFGGKADLGMLHIQTSRGLRGLFVCAGYMRA